MQLVCFEWFLTMLTPKLFLGLIWDVLAGIAQSCARADLSSLVEQAFSCLKIFYDLDRFSTVALMMEPILIATGSGIALQVHALLYSDLSVNIRLRQVASIPSSSETRAGQGPRQFPAGLPIPILWQPATKDVFWRCHKSQRRIPGVPWR